MKARFTVITKILRHKDMEQLPWYVFARKSTIVCYQFALQLCLRLLVCDTCKFGVLFSQEFKLKMIIFAFIFSLVKTIFCFVLSV